MQLQEEELNVDGMKVVELRRELRKRGLNTTGRKSELQLRLCSSNSYSISYSILQEERLQLLSCSERLHDLQSIENFLSRNAYSIVCFVDSSFCAPCRASKAQLERLLSRASVPYDDPQIGTVYEIALWDSRITTFYNVRAFPTIIVFAKTHQLGRVQVVNVDGIKSSTTTWDVTLMGERQRFKIIKKVELTRTLTTTSFVLKFEEEEGKITPSGTWKIEEEDERSFNEGLRRYDGTGVCWKHTISVFIWFHGASAIKAVLYESVAACRIQARVRGFAVRQMLRRPTPAPSLFGAEFERLIIANGADFCIAGNDDDDSNATITFPEDDEGLLRRRSSVAKPEVDQADNDDDSEVTRCECVGSSSFDLLHLDDNCNNATGVSVGQLLGLVVVFGVGAAVGDLLGPTVGFAVGAFVSGIVEHAAGGAAVGDWLGIEVGFAVGAAVGDLIGPAAGIAFGTAVGGIVGPSAGALFGGVAGNDDDSDATNDDDSDATTPLPKDDEGLLQLGLVRFSGGICYPNPSPS